MCQDMKNLLLLQEWNQIKDILPDLGNLPMDALIYVVRPARALCSRLQENRSSLLR